MAGNGNKNTKPAGLAASAKEPNPVANQASQPSAKDSGKAKEALVQGGRGGNTNVNSVNKEHKPSSDNHTKGSGSSVLTKKQQQQTKIAVDSKNPGSIATPATSNKDVKGQGHNRNKVSPQDKHAEEEADFEHIEKAVDNLIDTLDDDEPVERKPAESTPTGPPVNIQLQGEALPVSHENAYKWYYRDPQGELQVS